MSTDNTAVDLYRQINTKTAADFLGVTPRKLEQMRQRGTGPVFVRISPKCVRYRMKELIAFQDAHLRKNTIQAQDAPLISSVKAASTGRRIKGKTNTLIKEVPNEKKD